MLREAARLYFLMTEISALKMCMIKRYELSKDFGDPILLKYSEILDRKLNELTRWKNSICLHSR